MNKTRKLASLLLALVMVLGMVGSAMAYTIEITNSLSGHTYTAYQVFAGDLDSTGEVLSNIEWGTGVNAEALLTDLKAMPESAYEKCASAAEVAEVLKGFVDDSAELDAFAAIVAKHLAEGKGVVSSYDAESKNYVISGLVEGYYLVEDSGDLNATDPDAYSKFMLQVVNNVEVATKAEVPTLEKKIVEENGKVDANTAEIGEVVNYELTSKVPAMDGYNKYFFVIHDTMSEGLTFNPSSVVVKIGDTTLDASKYAVITTGLDDGCTFEIVLKEFIQYKAQKGQDIVITYSALVNEKAEIGENGNPNTANLEYSNNPNVDYEGDKDNPDKPGPGEETGETPDDTVITFVTELVLTKVDANDETILTGAKFQIKGLSSKLVLVNKEMFVKSADGTYYRLKDGTYTETAPTTENASSYDGNAKYAKVEKATWENYETEVETEGWVKADGTITFTGLSEGTYTITELVAPDGYNLLKTPITVTVTSNAASIQNPTEASKITWTAEGYTVEDGIIKITVENNVGSTLPSTGGMGTTLLYIAGSILVVGAFVLMITKRRVGTEK